SVPFQLWQALVGSDGFIFTFILLQNPFLFSAWIYLLAKVFFAFSVFPPEYKNHDDQDDDEESNFGHYVKIRGNGVRHHSYPCLCLPAGRHGGSAPGWSP